ncbi:MAG: outer membrane protein assembly factor BamD [Bacteroidota bacterium]
MLRNICNTLIVFTLALFVLTGCRTEFEKVRTGNDVETKYKSGMELYDAGDYYKAQILFEQILGPIRSDARVEEVYFKYAYTQYYLRKYVLAAYYFKRFTDNFPNSQFAEEAAFMTAYSNYELSPTFRLDQTFSQDAVDAFQLFTNRFPESDRVTRANALIDELRAKMEKKAFNTADLYFKLQDYKAAHHTFSNLLKDFPDATDIERARFMVLKASHKLAENSIDFVKVERYQETIDAYYEFIDRHPASRFKKEAEDIFDDSVKNIDRLKSIN